MSRRRSLPLTDPETQALIAVRDHDPHPDLRERCAALLKIAAGASPHAVARTGLLRPRDPDTVYSWLNLYVTAGRDGLRQHRHGGPRRRAP
jgi:Winged helix-turn helix